MLEIVCTNTVQRSILVRPAGAGRVIRSERDIGVIALLCRRFGSPSYTRYFPADWYEKNPRELVTKNAPDLIRKFFEEKTSPQLRLL